MAGGDHKKCQLRNRQFQVKHFYLVCTDITLFGFNITVHESTPKHTFLHRRALSLPKQLHKVVVHGGDFDLGKLVVVERPRNVHTPSGVRELRVEEKREPRVRGPGG